MQNALKYMRNWWVEQLHQASQTKFEYFTGQSQVDQFVWVDNSNIVDFFLKSKFVYKYNISTIRKISLSRKQ